MTKKAYLSDMLYVPVEHVRPEHVNAFTYTFEKVVYEKATDVTRKCANCKFWKTPWIDYSGNEVLCHLKGYKEDDYCKKFDPKPVKRVEHHEIATCKQLDNLVYVFNRGDLGKIEKVFGDFQIIDQRSAPALGIPLKLKEGRVLRDDQMKTAEDWLKHGYGIVKAPTGWGKTVLWCYLVQRIGLRTLLLAQETRHLQVGWEGLYEHTNIEELENELGIQICGRLGYDHIRNKDGSIQVKKSKDPNKTYPITFSTFQALNSKNGKKILENIKNDFGLVWLEEAHHESAETFHLVTKSFNSWYKGGQSATPTRKDQTHYATYDTIGPITAVATKEQMNCAFTFIATGVRVPDNLFYGQYPLPRLFTYLAKNPDVQNTLLQWILYDIQCGRKPLYITERKADAFSLKDKIHMSGYNVELIMGGVATKAQQEYSSKLMEGKLHAIIGTKVIKENYNIPPLDTLHLLYPNFGIESEEQMTGRIRRYILDANGDQLPKNEPLIRVYTFESNNKIVGKSYNFRRNFYKKMNFREIKLNDDNCTQQKVENKTVNGQLKDW